MDYLFFNAGECEDALRDRTFILVRDVETREEANTRLYEYFVGEGYGAEDAETYADFHEVFVYGPHLWDGYEDIQHWNYRMVEI